MNDLLRELPASLWTGPLAALRSAISADPAHPGLAPTLRAIEEAGHTPGTFTNRSLEARGALLLAGARQAQALLRAELARLEPEAPARAARSLPAAVVAARLELLHGPFQEYLSGTEQARVRKALETIERRLSPSLRRALLDHGARIAIALSLPAHDSAYRGSPPASGWGEASPTQTPWAQGPPQEAPLIRLAPPWPRASRAAWREPSHAAALAAEMAAGPVNTERHGSEASFLRRLSRAALAASPGVPARSLAAETRFLQAALRWFDRSGLEQARRTFTKNLFILSNILYLTSSHVEAAAPQRLELAQLRAAAGVASLTLLSEGEGRASLNALPESPLVRWTARLAGWAPGEPGRVLRDAAAVMAPTALGRVAFPSVSEAWARSPERRGALRDFHRRLEELEARWETLQGPPSLWELAVETAGSPRAAVEMLGGIVGQIKYPLRHVEREVLPRFPEAAGAELAFAKAAQAHTLMGVLHERSLRRFGRGTLYPEGYEHRSGKFYHFYAAALLADGLAAHPEPWVRRIGRAVALGYETVTFPINLLATPSGWGWARAALFQARASLEDILLQGQGNAFGRSLRRGAGVSASIEDARTGRGLWQAARVLLHELGYYVFQDSLDGIRYWRRFISRWREREASAARPAVRDPHALYGALNTIGWTGNLNFFGQMLADDALILEDARRLLRRHFAPDPATTEAFERYLERARLSNPGRRPTKLRKELMMALEASALEPPRDLPAVFDRLATPEQEARRRAFQVGEQVEVLEAFRRAVDQAVAQANGSAAPTRGSAAPTRGSAAPGGRVLGAIVFGSYANGAALPGSDIDFQVLAEPGAGLAKARFTQALNNAWGERQAATPLSAYSFSLPPSRRLVNWSQPEGYLVVSPYPRLMQSLASTYKDRAGLRRPSRLSAAGRLMRGVYRTAFRFLFWLTEPRRRD